MQFTKRMAALLLVVLSVAIGARVLDSSPERRSPSVTIAPRLFASPYASDPTDAGTTAVRQYYEGLAAEQARLEEEARQAEAVRIAAEARARQAALPSVPRPAAPSTSSGPHSDTWWHAIAICEQGGRNDPFFGYFSIMDGSAGGLDWSTQVAMANAIIARAGDGAWASACVTQAYVAAPGG